MCVLIVLLGGGICRRNIQEGLPSVWLFINLGGAQEDSQREELNRNLKPKFHDRFQSSIFGLVWPVDAVINCQRQHQQILMFSCTYC